MNSWTSTPLCAECGAELDPEPVASSEHEGMRIAWFCSAHGLATLASPFDSTDPV
jgi:hypothetical protein